MSAPAPWLSPLAVESKPWLSTPKLFPCQIYRQFPGFEYLILDSMARADMFFRSDEK